METTLAAPAAQAAKAPPQAAPGRAWLPLGVGGALALLAVLAVPAASFEARAALGALVLVSAAWFCRKLDDTFVALVGAGAVTACGALSPAELFGTLGAPIVWLLLASFVLAAGVQSSGLSLRFTLWLVPRARTVSSLFYLLTTALVALTFLIPATSGRAAVMLPLFLALDQCLADRRLSTALALLFPVIIEVSAVGSLLGAGANLVAAEALVPLGGRELDFSTWLVLGLPLALAASYASTWVILRTFLGREERQRPLTLDRHTLTGAAPLAAEAGLESRWSGAQKRVAAIFALVVLGWMAKPWLGFDPTLVALFGALVLVAPGVGVMSLKDGLKGVNWSLLLFLAATVALAEALVASGAAEAVLALALGGLERLGTPSLPVLALAIAACGSLAHLVVTSRSARVALLLPPLALFGTSLGLDVTAVAFLATAAAGFCFTTPASAKPVALFASPGAPCYGPAELLRLSRALLPVHLALLLLFALFVWPELGLPLVAAR